MSKRRRQPIVDSFTLFIFGILTGTFLCAVLICSSILGDIKEEKARGAIGLYFPHFNLIYCNSRHVCLHEVGHFLDKSNGEISQTKKFRDVIRPMYGGEQIRKVGGEKEIYAEIYATYDGCISCMPQSLWEFYLP